MILHLMRITVTTALFMSLTLLMYSQPFTEVAQSVGVTSSFGAGIFCGGISFVDFNGDGWDDLSMATQENRPCIFYENTNGQFIQVDLGILDSSETKQILWVDVDNDGDKDLYLSNFNKPNRLYINDGQMNLTDQTASFGLPIDIEPCFGATFGDYNRDGYLDLYVVNRDNTASITNHLYKNNNGKSFSEVSLATCTTDPFKVPFCASFVDINNNLWPDIYIASDRVGIENTMLKNLGDDKFLDISMSSGTNIAIDAMNVGFGDYDLDGDLDIYITNTAGAGGSVLLQNNGDETYTDVTTVAGATWLETGWGGSFFDYDNDQDEDLYVSNGFGGADEHNALFDNNGHGTFDLPITNELLGDTLPSFTNAIGDINNDGFLDMVVSHEFDNPHQIWLNTALVNNKWIKVRLEGIASNRDGTGSWIEVYVDDMKQVRYTAQGIGYLAQNSSSYHFGLGSHTSVDSLIVKWISGHVDKMYDIPINQTLNIIEYSTTPCPDHLYISNNPIDENNYRAKSLLSTPSEILTSDFVQFLSGDSILLMPNFGVSNGAMLEASIQDCIEN